MLSTVAIATLPLIGVIVGALLQFATSRNLDRQRQLILQKSQSYADYCRSLAAAARRRPSSEILSLAADAKTRICIYGSPSVIGHLAAFERLGANTGTPDGRRTIGQLVAAMRADIGTKDANLASADLEVVLFGPD